MGSERGIGMIWWVIVLLVLFLVSAGMAYDQYTQNEVKREQITQLERQKKDLDEKVQEEINRRRVLAEKVGFKPDETSMESDPDTIDGAIQRYKTIFQDPAQDLTQKTLEAILGRARKMHDVLVRQLADAKAARDKAVSDESMARDAHRDQITRKDTEINRLTQEKQQAEERYNTTVAAKDQEIEALRTEKTKLQESLVAQANEFKKQLKDVETDRDRYRGMANEAAETIHTVKSNNAPDGRVVSRFLNQDRVYVDLGARHGLKEGTAFEVFDYAKGNVPRIKGAIVIQEVKPNYALAAITHEVDEFDPIGTNDLIRNPLYESGKRPKFFLMGDMTGRLSNQETERLIHQMGGEVVSQVTVDTDFVVLGRKESDSAPPFENRPDYERAKLFNVDFINSDYLLKYLSN